MSGFDISTELRSGDIISFVDDEEEPRKFEGYRLSMALNPTDEKSAGGTVWVWVDECEPVDVSMTIVRDGETICPR